MRIRIKKGFKYFSSMSSFDTSVCTKLLDSEDEEVTVNSFTQLCGIVEFQTIQGIDYAEFLYIPIEAFELVSGLMYIEGSTCKILTKI